METGQERTSKIDAERFTSALDQLIDSAADLLAVEEVKLPNEKRTMLGAALSTGMRSSEMAAIVKSADDDEYEKVVDAKEHWQEIADSEAENAHENHFEKRFGIEYLDEEDGLRGDLVCYFNNNPVGEDPPPYDGESTLRSYGLTALRQWMKNYDIRELACGSYPENGYTVAMIMDVPRGRFEDLVNALETINHLTFMFACKRK